MRAAEANPIGDEEGSTLLAPVAGARVIALAVSGGPDSLALLHVAASWAKAPGRPPIHVFTVDHQLRETSSAEAERVAAIAAAYGLPARILVWDGPKPLTGVEEAARDARYRLLTEAAREIGASHVLLAHHRDDQAETFLMRLARGSGPFGLRAMRSEAEANGVILFRPFLDVPKERLQATARAAGLAPVDDPMNEDPRFTRARLRQLMPALAAEGIDGARLGSAAERMGRVAEAIDHYASRAIRTGVTVDDYAVARLDLTVYAAEPAETRIRVLTRLLLAIGGGAYPPRSEHLDGLDRLFVATGTGSPFKKTLAGTVIEAKEGGARLYREIGRRSPPPVAIVGRFDGVWDHRFRLAIEAETALGLTLAPLGFRGVIALGERPTGVPAAALAALPSLRAGEEIVALPGKGVTGISFASHSILAERLAA